MPACPRALAEFEARLIPTPRTPPTTKSGLRLPWMRPMAWREPSETFRTASRRRGKLPTPPSAEAVTEINQSLAGIARSQRQDPRDPRTVQGTCPRSLMHRPRLVDRLATQIPVETRRDAAGTLQVFSKGGEILVDRDARSPRIQHDTGHRMPRCFSAPPSFREFASTVATWHWTHPPARSAVGGLPPTFAQRDDWAPAAQARLDGVARDLVERFETAGLDATLPPAAAGLFTDAGARSDPALEQGLAARLAVNAAVRPEEGGAVWRLRDGPRRGRGGRHGRRHLPRSPDRHSVRHPDHLVRQLHRICAKHGGSGVAPDLGHWPCAPRRGRARSQCRLGSSPLFDSRNCSRGVDTDAEMQNLIRIEQMYAAKRPRWFRLPKPCSDELMRMTR